MILKEQKYLFVKIMKSQQAIEPKLAEHMCQLFEDVPNWELMADVDFDEFAMPSLPILQMTKPSSFIKIKEKQKKSIFKTIAEPLTKFFMKSSGGMSKDSNIDLEEDYRQLMRLRIFFKHASMAEKRALGRHLPGQGAGHRQESSEAKPQESHRPGGGSKSHQPYQFGKIVGQRHGSDFLRFNLGLSGEAEVADRSRILVLQVLRALLQWNKRMPENGVLILFPELLQR